MAGHWWLFTIDHDDDDGKNNEAGDEDEYKDAGDNDQDEDGDDDDDAIKQEIRGRKANKPLTTKGAMKRAEVSKEAR